MRIIGIGDNVMDAYLHQNKLYPGGNSINVAVLAKRFGAEASAYIGLIGNDEPGKHFLVSLKAEQLDVSRVRVMEGITAQNFINIDEKGDRHFVGHNGTEVVEYMASLMLNHGDYAFMEQYTLLHTSIHSCLNEYLPAISRKIPISIDFSNDGFTKVNIRTISPLLSFAFFSGGTKSEEEVRELAQFASECGAKTVIVTMGENGSYILEGEKSHRQLATPAKIVDALGAGDAFIASFLTAYHNHNGDISVAAQKASDFAAKCCEYHGAFERAMQIPAK